MRPDPRSPQGGGPGTGRVRRVAGVSARAARAAAASTSRAARSGTARLRRAASAEGAGQSGLSRLIELNGFNAAADVLVAVALADTLFFSVATSEARGRVALYLVLTMAPFAVVAPVIGPFLDRFRHGRRWAIGTTTALRGFLCWVMAGAVLAEAVWLYPAAFGCLVASKAFAVTRAAAVPRLLPDGVELVTANSRVSMAAVIGAAVAAPIGVGLAVIGSDWPLRIAFLAYAGATVQAILLPARVDSAAGEGEASLREGRAVAGRAYRVGGTVVRALRANTALRAFSGFLTFFLAFVLREEPVAGLDDTVAIALVAVAAWVGSTVGTTVGATTRARSPDRTVLALVAMSAAIAALTAVLWGLVTVVLVALAAGFGQQLGRLSLDAVVQRDVPEHVRASAFARSDALLQLAWVLGGGLGIALPLVPPLGMGIAAVALVGGLVAAQRVRPEPR
ncbi:MAG TPA: MFS transporter [Jiangellaceae bacterium]|nr:MFS transporter [Jiangellaceae bacterium]